MATVKTTQYKVTADSLNFREKPSINAKSVCVLKKNQTVQVVDGYSKTVKEVNKSTKAETEITWLKIKSNSTYIYASKKYLTKVTTSTTTAKDTTSGGDKIWKKALEISKKMVADKNWYYRSSKHPAVKTWSAAQKSKRGSSCSYFVSWVLQECGYLKSGKILSHTKAGNGNSSVAKVATGHSNLKNCSITLLNKKISSCSANDLKDGDVVIHDSSIGIFGHVNGKKCVLSGRSGSATLGKNNVYKNMTIYSGYEFNNKVFVRVRAKS